MIAKDRIQNELRDLSLTYVPQLATNKENASTEGRRSAILGVLEMIRKQ